MISNDCLSTQWIESISQKNKKADKILIEKVIRALLLLEGLAESGVEFVFKGGTSLMLLQHKPKRFSVDIDIIIPKKQDLLSTFNSIVESKKFVRFEMQKRQSKHLIEKEHYKFYYKSICKTDNSEDNILLDILYEQSLYQNVMSIDIDSQFIKQNNSPIKVNIPSIDDILGDKLTAFAPHTTGIPYEKNGRSMTMEINKQLYDIGNLFNEAKDNKVISNTFISIAKTEMGYRELKISINNVLEDIFETALCISTRGKEGKGDFVDLQNGIKRLKSYIFSETYHIEKAIINASKAAYLSGLIKNQIEKMEHFTNPEEVKNWNIEHSSLLKLNKLKKSNPEAFFYWYKISILIE